MSVRSIGSINSKPERGTAVSRDAYVPDLSAFMSLCDANYAKMMQLLPEFELSDQREFGLSRSEYLLGEISITIVERCKFTTTLDIALSNENARVFLAPTRMQVRLYHDARMAEVLAYQGHSGLRPQYPYPNGDMLQPDEKALCNEFLADCLSYCLKFGQSHEIIRVDAEQKEE